MIALGLTLLLSEARIDSALEALRAENGFALIMTGVEQNKEYRINTYASWAVRRSALRLEIYHYKEGMLTRRLVADGVSLTDYDVKKNQYTSARYEEAQNTTEALIKRLRTLANGNLVTPVRLLQDVFSGSTNWKPWLPLAQVVPGPDRMDLLTPTEGFRFDLPDGEDGPMLSRVRYWNTGASQEAEWKLDVFSGFVPAELTFKFEAPAGSRAVSTRNSVATPPGG